MDFEDVISFLPKPISFLRSDSENAEKFRKVSKDLYDFALKGEKNTEGFLTNLLIDGFDNEQVWQQLELYNDNQMNAVTRNISKLLVKDNLSFAQESDNFEESQTDGVAPEEESDAGSTSDLSELDVKLDDESGSDKDDFDELFNGAEEEESEADGESGEDDEAEEPPPVGPPKRMLPVKPSVVDDKFFKLSEMEDFLNREDLKAEKGDDASDNDESIDFFQDVDSEDTSDSEEEKGSGAGPRYKDFFDPVDSGVASSTNAGDSDHHTDGGDEDEAWDDEEGSEAEDGGRERKVRFSLDNEEDESDEEIQVNKQPSETQSSFEKRQARLKETIKALEEEALAPKSWQLGGEVVAEARPENALLEEDLVFDHVTRQAPVITEETNRTLEEVIKQRIKDQAWDDVERKIKPVLDPYDFKKRLVLDQEKSKLSLAEVYEQEYLKAQEKKEVEDPRLLDPLETDVNEEHEKIKTLMQNLFCKLDALANYHYTPKTPAPKIQILTNTPTLAVDEVVPVAVSDQALLAPEEIKDKQRGELKGKTERTETDKKRERRKKKQLQHGKRLHREEKERQNKDSTDKMAALEKLVKSHKEGKVSTLKEIGRIENSLKSSRAFFAKLQDEVTANEGKAMERGKKRTKNSKKPVTAKKLRTS